MKRLIAIAAVAVALSALAGPVYAQRSRSGPKNANEAEEQQKREEAARIDRQYKATLKRMDNKSEKVVVDPWKDMRGTADAKTKP
ncbi:MAG: hypothetical protein ACREB2_09985 [Pseudolabrys sp.]